AHRPGHPLPRRRRGTRRQGRELRRAPRRRGPRRAGRPLRRDGRRRARLPRHHRLVGGPRHDDRRGGAHGRGGVHPPHRGRRRAQPRRRPAAPAGRRRQGVAQHRCARRPPAHRDAVRHLRRPVHRGRDRRPALGRRLRGPLPRGADADRAGRRRLGGGGGAARGRRDPPHVDGPGRHPRGLRPRAHLGGHQRVRRPRHRQRRRRDPRPPRRGRQGRRGRRRPRRLDLPLRRVQRGRRQGGPASGRGRGPPRRM
ncbi:MAG: Imidazole glycerol phosphate synthase cyclase subunit HisF, partial [uncultured Acidimicrobiales bacterium]